MYEKETVGMGVVLFDDAFGWDVDVIVCVNGDVPEGGRDVKRGYFVVGGGDGGWGVLELCGNDVNGFLLWKVGVGCGKCEVRIGGCLIVVE